MKTVLFAGGFGTRISEESHLKPKPMIEIGGKPILWHIMKIYEKQGFNEFVICLGYKGYMIKEYFINYFYHNSDLTIDLQTNETKIHQTNTERFKVTLVDTGLGTKTAGRLKRIREYLGDEPFLLTYGDGVADVDLHKLLERHKASGKTVTLTAVQPVGKFGALVLNDDDAVTIFHEKPKGDRSWINGGFMAMEPGIFDYLDDDADAMMLEDAPLENVAKAGELAAYKHRGFWKCMDALRDKEELELYWREGRAGWKIW